MSNDELWHPKRNDLNRTIKKQRNVAKTGNREIFWMDINRGDVWLVNLEPTIGTEIRKTRPVIVVNSDGIGVLPIRLVAPLTEWKGYFGNNIWHVKIMPDNLNGLEKISAVDALQLRGIDTQRFVKKLGSVSNEIMINC